VAASDTVTTRPSIPIPPTDPLASLLVSRAEPVDLTGLELDSSALAELREAGVVLVVPLIHDGRLLGTVNLGPRKSEQDYTTDDRSLLATLASQLAPAIRLASLARRQEEEAAERQRIAQELQVARVIQQTLLPTDLPDLPGWTVSAHYRPAREVGGDFYDVIETADGRIVVVEGDVTDKGVPAALVMATCRAALRAAAEITSDPGQILARANRTMVDDIPPGMFVTCFCGVVELDTGRVRYANAGHPVPIVVIDGIAREFRASGMPLGLLAESTYEVVEADLPAGAVLVVASDGVAEAFDPEGAMYGFDRVARVVGEADDDPIDALLDDVDAFTFGAQDDDITIVALRRRSSAELAATAFVEPLLQMELASEEGCERAAMERVKEVATGLGMDAARVDKLGTAVAEAVMNAAEHGNGYDPGRMVGVALTDLDGAVVVAVSDSGGGVVDGDLVEPDLEAKLDGEQTPRGWGRFLIERLVDEAVDRTVDGSHVLELRMRK
jgi:serine phosphatase RsbU (regulator of sigma subunit)/anti-sigma regulatory factor (Ser/Thr protein kinase)